MIGTFTDQYPMMDHKFILLCFHHFATEDCVSCSFQRVVIIDLGKDVHNSFVVHLRRLEYHMDDCFIHKHNVVGERPLEGTLRGTDGLGAGIECSHGFVQCPSMCCVREDVVRCCWVRHGGGGHQIHDQYRNYMVV